MRVISTPRGGGKTDSAIRLSAETGAIMVVASMTLADRAAGRAHKLGLAIPRPITFDNFLAGSGRGTDKGFILDGVEMLISRLAPGRDIVGITVDQG